MKQTILITSLLTAGLVPIHAGLFITEVDPSGSGTVTYSADWFELTNTGPSVLNIAGWKVDDNSNSFASSVGLRGVTSIGVGQSVIFIEGNATGTTDATIEANFRNAWFGANVPPGFVIGAYGGSGVGLSQSGDAVNIYDSLGVLQANVSFSSAIAGVTFDNAADLTGPISQTSVTGINGAFLSPTNETGSPGAVPEPSTFAALLGGAAMLLGLRRRNRV